MPLQGFLRKSLLALSYIVCLVSALMLIPFLFYYLLGEAEAFGPWLWGTLAAHVVSVVGMFTLYRE